MFRLRSTGRTPDGSFGLQPVEGLSEAHVASAQPLPERLASHGQRLPDQASQDPLVERLPGRCGGGGPKHLEVRGVGAREAEFDGVGRRRGPMLEGKHKPVADSPDVQVRVPENVQVHAWRSRVLPTSITAVA